MIFLHFQKHTALSLLFRQRGMFFFFWISDFLCKFGILCEGRSVEIFHRKIVNQEQNINIHKIFESYRIFKSLVFYWVVRRPFNTFHMADWSVGPLIHWSVGPYIRLFVSPILSFIFFTSPQKYSLEITDMNQIGPSVHTIVCLANCQSDCRSSVHLSVFPSIHQ